MIRRTKTKALENLLFQIYNLNLMLFISKANPSIGFCVLIIDRFRFIPFITTFLLCFRDKEKVKMGSEVRCNFPVVSIKRRLNCCLSATNKPGLHNQLTKTDQPKKQIKNNKPVQLRFLQKILDNIRGLDGSFKNQCWVIHPSHAHMCVNLFVCIFSFFFFFFVIRPRLVKRNTVLLNNFNKGFMKRFSP